MERSEKIQIKLEPGEYRALAKWANGEIRGLEQQVRYVLRQELERLGLLQTNGPSDTVLPVEDPKQSQEELHATD